MKDMAKIPEYSICVLCNRPVVNTHDFWVHESNRSIFCNRTSDDMARPGKITTNPGHTEDYSI